MLDFSNEERVTNPIQDKGGAKFKEIVEKLCNKRFSLENALLDTTRSDTQDIEHELTLLREAMRTFGISDIDYEIFKVSKK